MTQVQGLTLVALLSLAPTSLAGCADRSLAITEDGGEESGAPIPGELYGSCMNVGDCFDEWCVHPASEPGFCTYPCAEGCATALGGSAVETCLPVDGEQVCALDCSDNKSCPPSMRCEQIEAGGEPRAICF